MSESPLEVQVGGDHYKDCKIQPVQFIEANGLQFLEGCVVKRVTRHDKPTGKGRQDIEKAIHELQLLLELRYPLPVGASWVPSYKTLCVVKPTAAPGVTTCRVSNCLAPAVTPDSLCQVHTEYHP